MDFDRIKLPPDVNPSKCRIVLVLGRSGSGKSTILRQLAGNKGESGSGGEALMAQPGWHNDRCVVSHFPMEPAKLSAEERKTLSKQAQAKRLALLKEGGGQNEAHEFLSGIGLSSIPTWCQPYRSLSQGERYRADLARLILRVEKKASEWQNKWKIVDEFTSCLDRTTAKCVARSLGRMLRQRNHSGWVLASANADIAPWLQPDVIISLDSTGKPHFSYNDAADKVRPDVRVRLDLDQAAGMAAPTKKAPPKKKEGGMDMFVTKKAKEEPNEEHLSDGQSPSPFSTLVTYDSVFRISKKESQADRWRGLPVRQRLRIDNYPDTPADLEPHEVAKLSKAEKNKRETEYGIIKAAHKRGIVTHLESKVNYSMRKKKSAD